jgi:hypothetical protein
VDGADSFSADYAGARGRFLDAAAHAGATVVSYGRDDVRGRDGEALACDVAVLGAADAPAAALVISGTHGAEGYCGSAIQHRWLTSGGAGRIPFGVKVVLVHAINPWAVSHKTRATENNVDLNRNFLTQAEFRAGPNPAYDLLAPFLHGPAGNAGDQFADYGRYRACLERHGAAVEAQSWAGQRAHPDGLFYTGTAPEWSNRTFRHILQQHLSGTGRIGFIDWHTGIGLSGEVVALIFDDVASEAFATAAGWWRPGLGGASVRGPGEGPAYRGLLCRAIRQELAAPRIAGAVIEFGTVGDYGIFCADRLDRWLRFEGRADPDHDRLREDYRAACCPDDLGWQRHVLARGPELVDQMVAGVAAWR